MTRMTCRTCAFVKMTDGDRAGLQALKNACTKLFTICQSTDIDGLKALRSENYGRYFLKPLSYTSHESYMSHLHFASRETPDLLTPNP